MYRASCAPAQRIEFCLSFLRKRPEAQTTCREIDIVRLLKAEPVIRNPRVGDEIGGVRHGREDIPFCYDRGAIDPGGQAALTAWKCGMPWSS
jgi:hypothetical protein